MRLNSKLYFVVSIISIVSIYIIITSCKEEKNVMKEYVETDSHILLIGASVGKAWNFPSLQVRLNNYKDKFEFIAIYKPDKSDVLEEVISRQENKPDIIIIKQCAAYFPANSESYDSKIADCYKKLAMGWIEKCKKNDIVPILATVVPITEKMPLWPKTKRMIKKYIIRKKISSYHRNIRQQGINDYNDWVRNYADKNGLIILDLESALRISESNRYLIPKLSTDGLHLNKKAYLRLDKVALKTLAKAE